MKPFYNAASDSAGELYLTGAQIAAIQSDIQEEIHKDRKELKKLRQTIHATKYRFVDGCRCAFRCFTPGSRIRPMKCLNK